MQPGLFSRTVVMIVAVILTATLTQCRQPTPNKPAESSQQPRSKATAGDVQEYLLASRWYADTTKNSYFGNGPLCNSSVGLSDTLDFISTTRVTMTGKDGRQQEAQWEARNVLWGLDSTPGVQLFINGREFPVMYATRDTMIFDTPWLDADCGGFRILAKAK